MSSEKARCVSRDADVVRGAWEAERPQGHRAFVVPLNLPLGLREAGVVTRTLVFLSVFSSPLFSWILKPNFVPSELGAGMFFEALSTFIFLIGIDLALGGSMCIQHSQFGNIRQSELEGSQRPERTSLICQMKLWDQREKETQNVVVTERLSKSQTQVLVLATFRGGLLVPIELPRLAFHLELALDVFAGSQFLVSSWTAPGQSRAGSRVSLRSDLQLPPPRWPVPQPA